MNNSLIPTQFGYTAPNSNYRSQIYLGKDSKSSFEAIGLGAGGRPDTLEALKIYLELGETRCILHLDMTDAVPILTAMEQTEIFLKLREVSVCEVSETTGEGVEKKMVVLASQTY